jgi:hypothetical protein
MSKKNETHSIEVKPSQEPQNQPTHQVSLSPSAMHSQASSPLDAARVTDSPSVPSVISADSIKAANARLVEASEVRQKRKYTRRNTNTGSPQSIAPGAPVSATQVPIDLSEAKMLLNMPFDMLADSLEFEEFRLSKDKLDQCAPLMHKVLLKYMPVMNGEHSALWALAFALSTHAGMAGWSYYQKLQKEQKDREAKSETQED